MEICPACNSKYETIYYQRRAADEPPDKVTFCPNCPVDIRKLSINHNYNVQNITNSTNTNRVLKHSAKHIPDNLLAYDNYAYYIQVEGSAAQKCYKELKDKGISLSPIVGVNVPVHINKSKAVVTLHLNSSSKNEGHISTSLGKIAPFISLNISTILKVKSDTNKYSNSCIVGYEYILDSIHNVSSIKIRTIQQDKQPCILLFFDKGIKPSDSIILSVLQQVLITYGTENSIKSFIDPSTISSLYTQSARAYDWVSAPTEGYTYTWKPDGERFWYIKYGSIWIFSRRLLSGRITGWNINNSLSIKGKAGPILDVEVMIGHDPILIDILALDSGTTTPALRSLEYVLDIYTSIKPIGISMFIRDYFTSEREVLSTVNSTNYPTDGIVGIEDGFMNIIKLKNIKSIELRLISNGDLVSAENKLVLNSNLQDTYPEDSIIEVRFSRSNTTNTIDIKESILRTDKTKANEYSVCQDIMRTISNMPDTLSRRKALLWCNSIRQQIHQIASASTGKGRVILDIGAGDGQGISDYSNSSDISYILLEPDVKKYNNLCRRLTEPGRGKYVSYDNASYISKVIGAVSKGLVKYAVVCATIEDILKQEHSINMLKNCVRYCVASFSISHTKSSLIDLALKGFQVIGCGYFYDNVNKHKFLINESGVIMKIHHDNTAKVKWGTDIMYSEMAIVSNDFKDIFHVRPATSLIPVVTDKELSLLNVVSANVFIISTKKHI